MKKAILKFSAMILLLGGSVGCGNDFLDTNYFQGVDSETALNSVGNIATALNGAYYNLFTRYFAGNYAITIGDVPTDIAYWNGQTGHWDGIYTFTFTDTDLYLYYIWDYGYKVADNAARIIEAAIALYEESDDKASLDLYLAEAYALRGYAQLMLTNIFCHQIKVDGTDFSAQPGIVVIDKPIEALTQVSRSTVGQSYEAVVGDLKNALTHFTAAGGDRGELYYFNVAATYGLLARTYLYLEQWEDAADSAQAALDAKGISALAYTAADYRALYTSNANVESMYALAISATDNWSANSCGTLWSTYNFSPSPKLQALYETTDCRTAIFGWAGTSTDAVPIFTGGKYSCHSSGNSAYATNYIVNAPEMFLIIAEANVQSSTGTVAAAQQALLNVAKRNSAITSASDLPANKSDLLTFIKDERARELFQEGLRLYDLRRWNENADVYAYQAPNIAFTYTGYKISDLIFPIPSDEITAGFGVEQNEGWAATLPK
jgi:hypothetical protein